MISNYCLTIGDPSGIGPEITAKLLQDQALLSLQSLRVIGDIENLKGTARSLGLALPAESSLLTYEHIDACEPGEVAYQSLVAAVEKVVSGKAEGVITGPVSKENLQIAGHAYSGQTEILQDLAKKHYGQDYQADMMFTFGNFRVLLLTRHLPLREVAGHLTPDGIYQSTSNMIDFLREHVRIEYPRLCFLGLNPHAGEVDSGAPEEETVFAPALSRLEESYRLEIPAPMPADAVFRNFNPNRPPYDTYIAAYHDQGLIPMKLLAGFHAVNVTIGLPFLRTSVSHGTAPDIVGKGEASPASLIQAIHQMRLFREKARI